MNDYIELSELCIEFSVGVYIIVYAITTLVSICTNYYKN